MDSYTPSTQHTPFNTAQAKRWTVTCHLLNIHLLIQRRRRDGQLHAINSTGTGEVDRVTLIFTTIATPPNRAKNKSGRVFSFSFYTRQEFDSDTGRPRKGNLGSTGGAGDVWSRPIVIMAEPKLKHTNRGKISWKTLLYIR